jgi:hypothetical protein
MTLKLSWTRFGLCFAVLSIFPALLIISGIKDSDSWPATAAVCLLFLSFFGFFALGWARLRRANATMPIQATEIDRIRQLLIGPIGLAIAWFVGTILLVIALVVASALFWPAV